MSDADTFGGRYATQAVESVVYDDVREPVGHVGLFDVDGVALGTAVDAATALPGPVAVLRTSERSYHLWGLAVREFGEWFDAAAALDAVDDDYLGVSADRERFVGRVESKVALTTAETVKPAPTLSRFVDDGGHARPLSEPHADLLTERVGLDPGPLRKRGGWVGKSVDFRTFHAAIGGESR